MHISTWKERKCVVSDVLFCNMIVLIILLFEKNIYNSFRSREPAIKFWIDHLN